MTQTVTDHDGPALARWWRRDARFDVPASLVVFLVAVPLSLGIAVASGAPVAAGLIAAAVGGIVAGLVGGSPLQVSGPAAGLTVVVAETINTFGFALTCAITAAAGVLQIILGVSRVGRFALAISPTVVRAMLAGIGLSILLGQLNVALGGSSSPTAWENIRNLPDALVGANVHAVLAASIVIATLLAWPRMPARVRVVPGPLVAVVGATVVAALALPDATRVDLGGSILSQVGLPPLPDGSWFALIGAVITVTLIASIESLLSAVAVDRLQDGPRARLDRELVGQGMANSASGLLGGLPVTGVIVRSATNVAAGARTRASAVLHGVWVLVFSLLLVGVVEQIPLAALAGLLVVMGFQLVKPADIAEARRDGELWIYVGTAGLVLALNLVEGVMIGLAATLVVILWRVMRVRVEASRHGDAPDGREQWIVEVRGTMSFLSTPRLVQALGSVPEGQVVEVDLLVDYLDPASREQLEQWRGRYEATGGTVEIEHPGPPRDEAAVAKASPVTSRAWMPWSTWQTPEGDRQLGATRHLATGIREFHRRTAHTLRPALEDLRDGQQPDAFFLSCTDPRVVPNLLTSSGPGDLFTVRTMGNFAPGADSPDAAVSAPLVYAVDQLEVPTVVVCGHSGCGAMTALLAGEPVDGPVGRWMAHAEPTLEAWRSDHPVGVAAAEAGEGELDQLAQVNVAVSLDRLRDELGPQRASRVAFVGLYFRVGDGTVWLLRDDRFVPLTDAEMVELAGVR